MAKPKSQRATTSQAQSADGKPGQRDKVALISEHIGRELRAMFDHVVAEPVPEKFQKLLEELERNKSKN